jgi:hypothetical protein
MHLFQRNEYARVHLQQGTVKVPGVRILTLSLYIGRAASVLYGRNHFSCFEALLLHSCNIALRFFFLPYHVLPVSDVTAALHKLRSEKSSMNFFLDFLFSK